MQGDLVRAALQMLAEHDLTVGGIEEQHLILAALGELEDPRQAEGA